MEDAKYYDLLTSLKYDMLTSLKNDRTNLQRLTVENIITLFGQKIQTLTYGNSGNWPYVLEFIPTAIMSEWDLAAQKPADGFSNLQEYWKTFMSESTINDYKHKLKVIDENGTDTFIFAEKNDKYFWLSDSGRFVNYRIAE